jgi:hypothetical protein
LGALQLLTLTAVFQFRLAPMAGVAIRAGTLQTSPATFVG